jgi:adenosine deaminase
VKVSKAFIEGLPKAELHLHIEGSFEPELMFEIAARNGLSLSYPSVEALKAAYDFNNLQEFLDIYYAGANVLLTEADFYDLTKAYLKRMHSENVKHVEVFFDPQTHTERGIAFEAVAEGILKALEDGQREYGISSHLIMSFLRHLSEEDAFKTLNEGLAYKNKIIGVGLDSSELGNPPSKFERVFAKAADEGFLLMAHAGEEGPASYIWEALDLLHVDRIDHGNRCLDDMDLVDELVQSQVALTLCPLSNQKLQVCPDLSKHPVKKMLDLGLLATIHSDDPAYFGGYMNANYLAVADALQLTEDDVVQLAINGFEASFLDETDKAKWIGEVKGYRNRFANK